MRCILVLAVVLFASSAFADPPELVAKVDINHATVEELCELPGIGPKRAEQIVDYRERKPFKRVTQLLNIRGIGHRTLRRLKPLVEVGPRAVRLKSRAVAKKE